MNWFAQWRSALSKQFDDREEWDDGEAEKFVEGDSAPAKATRPLEAVICRPRAYSDVRLAADALRNGKIVIAVLSSYTDADASERFVDFMSGGVYMSGGEAEMLSGEVLLCVPERVRIERDALFVLADSPVWRGEG